MFKFNGRRNRAAMLRVDFIFRRIRRSAFTQLFVGI
jgi:hypothetical protein